jgi:hypothetical protein
MQLKGGVFMFRDMKRFLFCEVGYLNLDLSPKYLDTAHLHRIEQAQKGNVDMPRVSFEPIVFN